MVNKEKHDKLKKSKETEEKMKELDTKLSEQMQDGFEMTTDNFPVRRIYNLLLRKELHDASYQRGEVWEEWKKKALVGTVIRYGGKKVPPVTFRKLDDGTMEMLDGKQRITSLKHFIDGDFILNENPIPQLTGYSIKDIEEDLPKTYGSFMSTEIPVQIISNMSDEDAVIYFIQVNSSGVQMNCGEKIHAMQGTPLIEVIDALTKHKVWENVTYVKRHNHYEYSAKMLLYIRETNPSQNIYKADYPHKLLTQLEEYREVKVPEHITKHTKDTLNFLNKVFRKHNFKVSIREFYNIFTYVSMHLDVLTVSDFGKFLKELYYHVHESKGEVGNFTALKQQHMVKGYHYTSDYYKWYDNVITVMFAKWSNGGKWDDIQRLSIK